MPKYRVFILETETFVVDVQANDEDHAENLAWDLFPSLERHRHDSNVLGTVPLPDDAEVENADA